MGKAISLTMTTQMLPTAVVEARGALTTEGVLLLAGTLSTLSIKVSMKMSSRWPEEVFLIIKMIVIDTTQTTIMVEDLTMDITRTRLILTISMVMVSIVGSSKASTARITVSS